MGNLVCTFVNVVADIFEIFVSSFILLFIYIYFHTHSQYISRLNYFIIDFKTPGNSPLGTRMYMV